MQNDFQNFIKNLDPQTLSAAMQKFQEFSKTDKGKEIIENLKNGGGVGGLSREELVKTLSQNPEALKKISEIMNKK